MIHDIDAEIGKRLRARRTLLGLSQHTVAEAIGITFQQVQKYEKGVNAMNARRLAEFARFMNVPVSYFFDDVNENDARFRSDNNEQVGTLDNIASNRESLELMKAFTRIKKQSVRKRLSDLVRAIADNNTILN